MTSLVKYEAVPPPVKTKTLLVVYRKTRPHNIECSGDRWMFLDLERAHYGVCGYSLDVVFLMDGITQSEFVKHPAFVSIQPNMRPDAIILEAG